MSALLSVLVIAFMNTWQSEMFTERVHIREGAADAVPFALLSDDSNLCSEAAEPDAVM